MAIWKVRTKNGEERSELNATWGEVKDDISEMIFITNDNKTIKLPKNMEEYIQATTASVEIGTNNVEIESRYVGFSQNGIQVIIRVDEKTNNISVETKIID